MHILEPLFEQNRIWSEKTQTENPEFFSDLAKLQKPEYLWIGCSDSRVPANQIMGLKPGEVFVHRNIANVVVHSDLNCLSVVQYAVQVLRVKHILVVGHYGCGGVKAALDGLRVGLADNWLRHIHDVKQKHQGIIDAAPEAERHDRLCELNVIEQVLNLAQSTVVYDAWARGQELSVHGLIYGLQDGIVSNLNISIHSVNAICPAYNHALSSFNTEA
ncbi:MAG: carbonate dehydratase [Fluviibacter sp.]